MALTLKDRIKETTTTSGTGTYTLAGAETGFEAFSVVGDGNTTYYCCTDGSGFEIGIGTYTLSGTTLARTTILQSSNSDSAVDWASGSTRTIFCTYPGDKSVYLNASNQLVINGTAVTATAAELNIMDGVTSTATELNIMDGVTSTTTELNLLDGVTSTTAELNYNDTGSAVGTVVASKTVTADANKDVASFRNITLTGELDAGSLDVSGDADIDGTLEADAITVGGTALNTVIAGVTVTNATTAAVATTVTISDNESTNEENAIIFTAGGDVDGGNIGLESDGDLAYNPSTGTVTATVFKGNIDAVDGDFDGTLEADAITLDGTAVTATATLSTGISNNNVPKFTSGVADNDFLRVDGTAIEGRSASEVLSDISAAPAAGDSNILTTGALDSGSITSGFGAIDNGTSGIRTDTFTAETSVIPDASGGADLGSTSAEWGDFYIADDKYIFFGNDQNVKVGYDEDGNDALEFKSNIEGAALALTFSADEADDNADTWRLSFADGGTVTWDSYTGGSFATKLTLDTGGNLLLAGELQATNIGYTDGDNAITIADGGGITAANGITSTAAGNTLGTTSFNDADITNVGDIALDSITSDAGNGTAITFSQGVVPNTETASKSGTVAPDMSRYTNFVWTLGGNLVLDDPTDEVAGQSGVFVFIQDGTGSRTLSHADDRYFVAGGTSITLTTTASAIDIVPYFVQADGKIHLGAAQLAFAEA